MNRNVKRTVLICCGPGCLSNQGMDVYEEFKTKILISGLDVDLRSAVETENACVTDTLHPGIKTDLETMVSPAVKATGCQGLCEMGPLVRIEPDSIFYTKVKVSDVTEIIEKTLMENRVVERLLYKDPVQGRKVRAREEAEFYKSQLKVALRNVGEIDPESLDDYIERDGYRALKIVLSQKTSEDVLSEIEKSGLRGRGGAGFPTGRKWRQCARTGNYPKYVICNGDEGDPGAFMDRSIMEGDPHSVIEGMIIGAYAVGSHEGFMYIRDEYFLAIQNMTKALEQARREGFLGKNILGSGFDFDIQIVRGGGAFVCGESTALMASIEGKVGEPRAKYIRSVEKGLWGKPTVLNNVETWANVPVIINKGADWFCSIGTERSKGTKVFSLVGKVRNTGLIEVPMGVTLRRIIFDIGGGIAGGRKFKAVQTGGPSGGCIPESLLDLKVDFDTLDEAGSMMGSGGMIVMDDRTCMVDVARYYLNFLSEESCGKCVPCREGIRRMLEILNDICEGRGRQGDIELLAELGETVREASLCGLGKTAPNPVLTTIKYFKDEYLAHIEDKTCPAGVCKNLTTYYIDKTLCKSCGLCKKNCPSEAIEEKLEGYFINLLKCIKCGSCMNACRFGAVKILAGIMRKL
ncbi:4Fe-4S dicluster domain-containing protein [Biomaibacter acetigenes]|uniref:4Fe-4S dicluster domain-containing protein n=1 Tax=Biomaibacter acetigenes TaxID=2316383 RepID=A0A3G2R3N9_9FIRM|nr:NADH-quinone oxidoreductase subunit NuoF [Biomaibacter acetigenes]AYO29961.1 4Fe-4S dicluster domain-containing protein [Biomaibacter acetigenes]